jgi:hypothetical protein
LWTFYCGGLGFLPGSTSGSSNSDPCIDEMLSPSTCLSFFS